MDESALKRTYSLGNKSQLRCRFSLSSSFSSSVSCRTEKTRSFRGHTSFVCVGGGALTWCLVPSSMGSMLHCICRTWDTAEPVRTTGDCRNGRLHGAARFLPSWSPALRAQEWGFSPRGALWATSPPPAEAVVDKVSRTPSEGRSRSWDGRTKDASGQPRRSCCRGAAFPYLTSSKNLSSSRAGNCESLEEAEKDGKKAAPPI